MNTLSDLQDIGHAVDQARRMEEHVANGGAILQMTMPNGKALGDCTGEEVGRYGAWLQDAGRRLNELKASLDIERLCEWDESDDRNFANGREAA